MTEIDFHFNAPDKVGHACRLLRKAVQAHGARLLVLAPEEMVSALDSALWSLAPADFLTHCRVDASPAQRERSAVLLASEAPDTVLSGRPVMLNLACALPRGFERFERLIEVVTPEDADRQAGRQRWRHYADRGYVIRRHDVAAPAR